MNQFRAAPFHEDEFEAKIAEVALKRPVSMDGKLVVFLPRGLADWALLPSLEIQ